VIDAQLVSGDRQNGDEQFPRLLCAPGREIRLTEHANGVETRQAVGAMLRTRDLLRFPRCSERFGVSTRPREVIRLHQGR
jgi:hypothetical protein